jgi:hypothetical protein
MAAVLFRELGVVFLWHEAKREVHQGRVLLSFVRIVQELVKIY